MRGSELTVGRRATIVHELTHALQDQHFNLSRQGSYSSDDRNAAFEAVVEDDAVRMEDAYVDSLPKVEQDAYDQEQAAGDAAYGAGITGVPDWLSATTDFPYSVGESFTPNGSDSWCDGGPSTGRGGRRRRPWPRSWKLLTDRAGAGAGQVGEGQATVSSRGMTARAPHRNQRFRRGPRLR